MKPNTRRENYILDSKLDLLKQQVDYQELYLLKEEGPDLSLILYRGQITQTQAVFVYFNYFFAELIPAIHRSLQPQFYHVINHHAVLSTQQTQQDAIFYGVAIPILNQERLVGILVLQHRQFGFFTPERMAAVQTFVQQDPAIFESGIFYAEMRQKEILHNAIQHIEEGLAAHLDLVPLLELVTQYARMLTSSTKSALYLLRVDGFHQVSMDADSQDEIYLKPFLGYDGPVRAMDAQRTIAEIQQKLAFTRPKSIPKWHSCQPEIALLVFQDQLYGFIVVANKILGTFGERDRQALNTIAVIASIGIHNAETLETARSMSLLQERERLSRELHDDLAQRLCYLYMIADQLRQKYHDGKKETVEKQIEDLQTAINDTYQYLRDTLFDLRETILPEENFIASLQQFLAHYHTQSGIDIELHNQLTTAPSISSRSAAQLTRIIQEALTNIRRHANAQKVEFALTQNNNQLSITIQDDGCGFQTDCPTQDGKVHLGLKIMAERATDIGGAIDIESSPGRGTRIQILAPLKDYQ